MIGKLIHHCIEIAVKVLLAMAAGCTQISRVRMLHLFLSVDHTVLYIQTGWQCFLLDVQCTNKSPVGHKINNK
jgi:hypothetical protein